MPKREERGRTEKLLEEIKAKILKLNENHRPIGARNSLKSKHRKYEENDTKVQYN